MGAEGLQREQPLAQSGMVACQGGVGRVSQGQGQRGLLTDEANPRGIFLVPEGLLGHIWYI